MPLPFNDPSQFTTFDGPNGPVAIPNQFAPSFVLPPPPIPIGADAAPPQPVVPTEPEPPVPSVLAPLPPPTQAPLLNPDEDAALPAPVAPKVKPMPLPQARPAQPPSALDVGLAAIDQRRAIAQAKGDAESRAAQAEEQIYTESDKFEAAKEKERAAERAQEAKERDRARADIKDATDRYVNFKVDENRRWNDLSTGRKLMAGIAVAMSGLGNALARKGDARNGALDFIMETLKEDTRLQMDERQQLGAAVGMKRDALNDLRAQFTDNEAAYQAALGANTKFVANKIRTTAAGAKSETAKLNGLEAAAELDQVSAGLLQQAEEREHARKVDERNYRLAAAGQSLQNKKFERDKMESDRQYNEGVRRFDAELNLKADTLAKEAEAARAAGNAKEAERLDKKAKEERELGIGTGYDDKSLGKAPSPTSAERLRPVVAAGANAARLIDGIKRVRADSGSEWFKTPEARQLKADMGALIISVKNTAGLGALAGPDMELIEKFVGTTDATETDALNSMVDGLDRARANLIGQVRSELSAAQVEGAKDWNPPDLSKKPKTPTDERFKSAAVTAPGQSPGLVTKLSAQDEQTVQLLGGKDSPEAKAFVAQKLGGYTQQQQSAVDQIARGAATGATPEQRKVMLDQLQSIATSSSAPPGLRAYAEEKLKEVGLGTYKSDEPVFRPAEPESPMTAARRAVDVAVKKARSGK